ncbi:MAG: magnesium transporter, partial [Clostridia bacterium]|nr:magnesium transporter [Clostridia bacterium]
MTENKTTNTQELLELLNNRQYTAFMRLVDELNPIDAADFFATLPQNLLSVVFRLLKKDTAAEIFAELDSDLQEQIITGMSDREISAMLEELYTDDAVDMLEEMPAGVVKRIMKSATPETREEINRFLAYPEQSAGSVMTSEFIDLRKNMTCEEAVKRIR